MVIFIKSNTSTKYVADYSGVKMNLLDWIVNSKDLHASVVLRNISKYSLKLSFWR